MNAADEQSESLWSEVVLPAAPRLVSDVEVDVAIVGGGIAGLSAAYELSDLGKTVAVLDAGLIGGGMTSRTSGHLSYEFDDYYKELIRLHGSDAAKTYYRSQSEAVARIERIVSIEKIECSFERIDGYLFAAKDKDEKELDEELEAARKAGFVDAELLERVAGLNTGKAIRFPNQARFHVMRYLAGLAEALRKKNVPIYGNTRVLSVEDKGDHVLLEVAGDLYVKAQHAVVATNSPINDLVAMHTKQAPYRTYVFAAPVPKESVPDALIWDTEDPYHYVRIEPRETDDLLIVGGEDHKSGTENDASFRFERLQNWAEGIFGEIGEPEYRWSGQVYEPVDHVNFAGLNPGDRRVYVITGDSGEGLTSGVAGAMLIASLIKGTADKEVAALYDPSRKSVLSAPTFAKENADVPANLAEHLTGGEVSSIDALQPGQGGLVRRGLEKVAAYRDEKGILHLVSSTCTHLGCVVHFNALEKCWDCPCHGSQFSVDGEVLAGPARVPLRKVEA